MSLQGHTLFCGKEVTNIINYGYQNEKDFVELFKQRKLTFVVAFRPTSHVGYTVKDNPERFNSNIAKYSLYWTIREFKNLDINYDIKICEINNE